MPAVDVEDIADKMMALMIREFNHHGVTTDDG